MFDSFDSRNRPELPSIRSCVQTKFRFELLACNRAPDRFVRVSAGSRRASLHDSAGTPAAIPPPPCHFAPDWDNDGVTTCRAGGRFWLLAAFSAAGRPHRDVLCVSQVKVMRHTAHPGRAARRWHTLVGVRWQRLQGRIAGHYFVRVTQPLQWWVAFGRPPEFRPSLPWWQPFVWHWLHITGWLPASRRRERPV